MIDLDGIVAIDVHTHVSASVDAPPRPPSEHAEAMARYFRTEARAKNTVLFGSDFPVITPDRWLADFEKIDIRPEGRPLILKDNAARLLGLGTH